MLLQIKGIIQDMKALWSGFSYDLLNHNCCHFCADLAQRLGVQPVPGAVTASRMALCAAVVSGAGYGPMCCVMTSPFHTVHCTNWTALRVTHQLARTQCLHVANSCRSRVAYSHCSCIMCAGWLNRFAAAAATTVAVTQETVRTVRSLQQQYCAWRPLTPAHGRLHDSDSAGSYAVLGSLHLWLVSICCIAGLV